MASGIVEAIQNYGGKIGRIDGGEGGLDGVMFDFNGMHVFIFFFG